MAMAHAAEIPSNKSNKVKSCRNEKRRNPLEDYAVRYVNYSPAMCMNVYPIAQIQAMSPTFHFTLTPIPNIPLANAGIFWIIASKSIKLG